MSYLKSNFINVRAGLLCFVVLLSGCGGGSSDESDVAPDNGSGSGVESDVSLTAQDSLSVFKVSQPGVVNITNRVQASDQATKIKLVDVTALSSNPSCEITSVNDDNFVVSSTQPSACYYQYTATSASGNSDTVSAVSQVTFQPQNVAISANKAALRPVMLSIDEGQCQSVDVSASLPAGSSLDSDVVIIGSGTATVADAQAGLIEYCAGGRGQNDLFYSAIDDQDATVFSGSVAVAVSVDANNTPIAHAFSYYYNPADLTVKVPAGESVVIDVKDYVEDVDTSDELQLIEVQASNATVALTDAADMKNTSFTFSSDLAGTYYVSYHINDHLGGHSVGVVRVIVDSPFDDYYVDTGDVNTSFTLTAPITLAEIEQYGIAYLGQASEGMYELATFNHQLAQAICKARGGSLAEQADLDLAFNGTNDITQVMSWPASRPYIVDNINPNGSGDDTVAAWDNESGTYIEQGAYADQGYFTCKNIKPRDFKIRDPYYVIAGTIKDLIVTYTNSAGSNQFYIRGLHWTSSDSSILQIDESTGRAEGMQKGTVTVTARSLDGELIDSIEVDVIDQIPVFGMGSLNNQSENGFNLAVEQSRYGDTIAANAILRDTQNFGPAGASVRLLAQWVFETADDYHYDELRDALVREYPPAIVQIGYPNRPDAVTTNALRDFLYDGGVLMYFSQDTSPTNNIMRAIFGDDANAGTFTGSGGVFQFADIDDPVIKGPFGDLGNQYWGLDQSQVAYVYDLPENSYVPFSFTYDESRGWDAGGSIGRTGVTALRHKTLKFIWTGDAGFFGFHTNDPNNSASRTNAYPLMVADYNKDFALGDYRPVVKPNYGSNTKFSVSNSIFFANAVTWLFGAAPSSL